MVHSKPFFPSQRPNEKISLLLRRHWFTYVMFWNIGLIMSIPLFVLAYFWIFSDAEFSALLINVTVLGGFSYLLFIIGLLFYGFIDYYLDVYIVTNERIVSIEQNGFFKRKISELHLHQIQDVSAQVLGAFATLLHYGDIHIQTAGERENFVFRSIPNPYRISKIIIELHEKSLEDLGDTKSGDKKPDKKTAKGGFNLDPATVSVARKRTKQFLRGGKLVETQFREHKNRSGEMKEGEEIDIDKDEKS